MNVVKKIAAAVGLTFATVASMATPVVIDNFNTGTASLFVGDVPVVFGGGYIANASQSSAGAGILGGYRKQWLSHTSGAGTGSSTMTVAGGVLDYSNTATSISSGTLRWDGSNTLGTDAFGLGADLSSNLSLDLTVKESDGLFGYSITLWGSDANTYSTLTGTGIPVPAGSPQTFNYYLSWFLAGNSTGVLVNPGFGITAYCGTSCVDLEQIGAISISLIGVQGATDLTVDGAAVVPEPASLALVGLGLLGAGFVGRRNKRA